jgi:hypothetical protein
MKASLGFFALLELSDLRVIGDYPCWRSHLALSKLSLVTTGNVNQVKKHCLST